MRKTVTIGVAAILAAAAANNLTMAQQNNNPLLSDYGTPFNIPPFEKITVDCYIPAFNAAVEEQREEIRQIVENSETPTFENTILSLEKAGDRLSRIMAIFSSLDETNSSAEMDSVGEVIYPLYSQISDETMMNPALFSRVETVYNNRQDLSPTQKRAVEHLYTQFLRNGAKLSTDDQQKLKEINAKLADLYLRYNKNLLNATNSFSVVVEDQAELSGLPKSTIAVAAEEAEGKGLAGKWIFTLHSPSRLPVLQYADSRQLRRKIYEGYINQAASGQYDNRPVINEILKARTQKANILGYPDYATYMTEDVMARTPQNAEALLMQIWEPAIARVAEEVAEMQAYSDAAGNDFKIEPWDYYYFAEKIRKQKYDLDEDEVRQYFPLESVRNGIFQMAERLYGVTFTELPDAPLYYPEVKVYEVKDSQGNHIAIFMTDYLQRSSKRQGAWMSEFQGAFVDPDGVSQRPIVYNVGNFTKPTAETPSLLTLDEVETMFHEFGHGLHGMLTQAELRSQAGTNVDRDFVELPSQIHEHWAFQPEMLKSYAHHYLTGEAMPDSLIERLNAASKHNQGFMTTELAGAALLDLKFGQLNIDSDIDVLDFERQVATDLKMPAEVQFRYRAPYFRHIFGSDGYASGYYTYLWAQVLDCDGFELFEEKGIFDPETAESFKKNVLEAGDTEDPMILYKRFRGHEPKVDALLRFRGLIPDNREEKKPVNQPLNMPGGK